ncbi:MAG: sulfotransferase family 2 domain-containing protein [Opitutales bacterium]
MASLWVDGGLASASHAPLNHPRVMLISHSHKFIFVHCMKTAGRSIEHALGSYAEPQPTKHWSSSWRKNLPAALGPLNRLPLLRRLVQYGVHTSALEARASIGQARWDSYYTFAIVRNPWDRLVSRYHHLSTRPHVRWHKEVVRLGSFAHYVRWEMEIARKRMHQCSDLCDRNGKVLVKFVGRFERLEADFAVITRELGLNVKLPHRNPATQPKADYRSYYDDELRDLVGRFCAQDCETFGYHFDGFIDR